MSSGFLHECKQKVAWKIVETSISITGAVEDNPVASDDDE
jgi:hypothetical protein